MVATVVELMLVAWLICTAAMTFYSRQSIRGHQPTGALHVRHVSGGPTTQQPVSASEPRER
ncbi:MAG TPA: hypothetical protein VKQ30_10435 [Ktedonobacterales bacterium]|nr:hypothetical protein [Ktedonobacterales bacterium]